MLEGNTAERRHVKFIPGGLTFQQTREPMLTDTFDEWLARVVCYAFSVHQDMYETVGAIDTALKEYHTNRKAKKPVAKRDGRAGRDADGDGRLNERGNQT